MAKNTTTEEVKSTVVLNDEPTVEEPTVEEPTVVSEDTVETTDNTDTCEHDENCTCEWGYCPKSTCERHFQNPADVPTTQEYVYHLDSDGAIVKDDKKANPNYKKEEDPVTPTPTPTPTPDPTPGSDDCGEEREEPWAHDEIMEDDDEHTGLEKEVHFHTGANWNIVESWFDEIKNAADEEAKAKAVEHVAWHIPTGGPAAIKTHHKEQIVALLKAL